MSFDSFALDERVMAGVKSAGYESPTPIQAKAIPHVKDGNDVLGLAQTGTGKTAAFVLPLLHRLLEADVPKRGPVRVLVLAPTRELALQIHDDFVGLGKQTGVRCASVFGGVGQNPQVKALRSSTIAVACPGRLLDLMNQGVADLSKVDVLVLDEADRMLDMGFMPDIKRILAKLPKRSQTLLFSATMPREISSLASELLTDPVRVEAQACRPATTVSHCAYSVDAKKKIAMLEQLLPDTEPGSVLVFTRTKHRAKSLALKLSKMGHTATSLQGNLSQNKRQQALDGFKKGKFRIMVATDIAARGIDCASVTHVINYDVPDTAENYTHRIGRTGRAERTGEALTLVSPDEASTMRMIERVLKTSIERKALDGFECAEPVSDDRPPRRGNRPANGRGGRSGRPANAEGRSNGPRRSRSRTSESGAEGESRGQRRGPKSGGSRKPSRRPSASSGGESRQHPPKRKVGYQGSNKDKNKQPVVEVGRGEWADVFSPE